MDKVKAKNCNDRSDDSGDINNDDAKNSNSSDSNSSDSNSSDSDKGNKAYRCVGRWGLLAPINSKLKLKYAVKYYL
jgi:hypothetical protein